MALPTASDNQFPKVILEEVANDGSATTTPAADHRSLFLGEDGALHLKDSAAAVTDVGGAAHAASHQNGGADEIDVTGLTGAGGAAVGNVWTMTKNNTSQTLTSNTLTQITFEDATIDGGSSVIDLANDKFETPATGFYLVLCNWLWEATAPTGAGAYITVKVGTTESITLIRPSNGAAASLGINGTGALSLTAGDDVTMWCHPGGAVTPTARGSASLHLRTSFTLVRIT